MYTYLYDNDGKYTPNFFHSNTAEPTTIRFTKLFNADSDLEFEFNIADGKIVISLAYDYSDNIYKGIIDGDYFLYVTDDEMVITFSLSYDNEDDGDVRIECSGLLHGWPITIDYYGADTASVTIVKQSYKIDGITLGNTKLDKIDLIRFMKYSGLLKINTHDLLRKPQ